jgi:hypothetical protein
MDQLLGSSTSASSVSGAPPDMADIASTGLGGGASAGLGGMSPETRSRLARLQQALGSAPTDQEGERVAQSLLQERLTTAGRPISSLDHLLRILEQRRAQREGARQPNRFAGLI